MLVSAVRYILLNQYPKLKFRIKNIIVQRTVMYLVCVEFAYCLEGDSLFQRTHDGNQIASSKKEKSTLSL